MALLYAIKPRIFIPRLDKNQIAQYLGGVNYFGSPAVSASGMSPFSHFAEMLSPLVRNLMMDLITPPSSEPLQVSTFFILFYLIIFCRIDISNAKSSWISIGAAEWLE